jgi:hypothetical protein
LGISVFCGEAGRGGLTAGSLVVQERNGLVLVANLLAQRLDGGCVVFADGRNLLRVHGLLRLNVGAVLLFNSFLLVSHLLHQQFHL